MEEVERLLPKFQPPITTCFRGIRLNSALFCTYYDRYESTLARGGKRGEVMQPPLIFSEMDAKQISRAQQDFAFPTGHLCAAFCKKEIIDWVMSGHRAMTL